MSDLEREESDGSNSESNVESQTSTPSRKRKAYSIDKKLEAVAYAKAHSKNAAANKFGVTRKMIRESFPGRPLKSLVPGGCTKFIQAADVCWNAPFKAKIRQLYDDWMMHGEKEVTKGGNPKPAPMAEYLQWIVDAWDSLPKELISKSFKSCGITNATDGSEDDEIHCFKADGPVPSGRILLQQARDAKELAQLLEEVDLEQEEENFYDSDASIV
uniref:DDE-1 domain-containing protein n=1 Tax=Acrobeloides nanus TaxID=290746 RepID=A0A914ELT7_9BILA